MPYMTSYAPGRFCWIELATNDGVAAEEFYTSLFGWTTSEMPLGDGTVYVIVRKNGKDAGALYEDKQATPNWLSYVSVASVDDAVAKAKTLGANVIAAPMDVPEAGRMAILSDPQGATFAVWQAGKHFGAAIAGEPGSICWNELVTPDGQAAVGFYTRLFGWTAGEQTFGDGPYMILKDGDQPAGGVFQMGPEMHGCPPYWTVYFAVEDCDASVTKAKALCASVQVPPTDIPETGRFAALVDPQGAVFSVIKLESRSA